MRITDRYLNLTDRTAPGAARPVDKTEKTESGARATTAKAKAPAGDALEVSVSGRAQELASRMARIDELRSAIKDGSFRVDSKRIAESLVGLVGGDEG
ncbi:MAG: flagellar biosynthesis anti-sigma factor FlgM [Labilithrix sp.]|nr:flagellar biosynthesis anti-sigma factor FlgM [Labilithrix sp.]